MQSNNYLNISSSTLWANCPFYMDKCQFEALSKGHYSQTECVNVNDEGSVAHKIAELYLKRAFNNDEINEEYLTMLTSNISKECHKYVMEYVSYVLSASRNATHIGIEEPVKDNFLYLSGRVDCYIVKDDIIEVVDFKTGKGKELSPNNLQLILYACCLGIKYLNVKKFKLTIFQPCFGKEKSIDIGRGDLFFLKKPASNAVFDWKLRFNPFDLNDECTGERIPGCHCDYGMCPLRDKCAKYHLMSAKKASDILSSVSGEFTDLKCEEISELMDALTHIQKTKESISDEIVRRLNHGENIPDYKLLSSKRIKKVNNEESVSKTMMQLIDDGVISYDEAFDLKSAVQLEKCLPQIIYDEFIRDNIKVELTKPTLKRL